MKVRAPSSGLSWLARRRALYGRTGWPLAGIGDPHAGPLTAGSEDTALWSSLGENTKLEIRVNSKKETKHFYSKVIQ